MNDSKFTLASRAVWVGIAMVALGVIDFVAKHEFTANYPAVVSALISISGILTIIFRYVADQKLRFKRKG